MEISRYQFLGYLARLLDLEESLSELRGRNPGLTGSDEAQKAVRAELVRVLKEVPGALHGFPGGPSTERDRTRLENWFLIFRPRSAAGWATHVLFYALCILTSLVALELGYSAFMGSLATDWGIPITRFGASVDVTVGFAMLVGLTSIVGLVARGLDRSGATICEPTTVRKALLWYWPPTFVSGFAQIMFYWSLFAVLFSPLLPRPWWQVPLGGLESAVLDLRFALMALACYLLAWSQWRPLAGDPRILSFLPRLLLSDTPRGALSWCATSCLALQFVLSSMTALWYVAGVLPFEVLLGIPPILLVTCVWALEERRRPMRSKATTRRTEVPAAPPGTSSLP